MLRFTCQWDKCLEIFRTEGESLVSRNPLRPLVGGTKGASNFLLDTTSLSTGSYVAEVRPLEAPSPLKGRLLLARWPFEIMESHQFEKYWNDLYGSEWETPIFLDNLTADSAMALLDRPYFEWDLDEYRFENYTKNFIIRSYLS